MVTTTHDNYHYDSLDDDKQRDDKVGYDNACYDNDRDDRDADNKLAYDDAADSKPGGRNPF